MTERLARIEFLVTSLTLLGIAAAAATGVARPFGVALGGGAALLDFVLIRRLAVMAFARRPALSRIVPMALLKSVVLLAIPGLALLVPASLVDGLSFAIGVTTLPAAVVLDACWPQGRTGWSTGSAG
jgi:hypothetical protein